MRNFFYKIFPKKYHCYEVKFRYVKDGKELFQFNAQIMLRNQTDILNRRTIKKIGKPLHHIKEQRTFLCNGDLTVEVICYLGKMSNAD